MPAILTVTLNPSLDRTLHFPGVAWGAVNRASSSALDLSGKRVAIERNGEIVPRSRHDSEPLASGDRLEIVVAVGGG